MNKPLPRIVLNDDSDNKDQTDTQQQHSSRDNKENISSPITRNADKNNQNGPQQTENENNRDQTNEDTEYNQDLLIERLLDIQTECDKEAKNKAQEIVKAFGFNVCRNSGPRNRTFTLDCSHGKLIKQEKQDKITLKKSKKVGCPFKIVFYQYLQQEDTPDDNSDDEDESDSNDTLIWSIDVDKSNFNHEGHKLKPNSKITPEMQKYILDEQKKKRHSPEKMYDKVKAKFDNSFIQYKQITNQLQKNNNLLFGNQTDDVPLLKQVLENAKEEFQDSITFEIQKDENDNMSFLLLQTPQMKYHYQKYGQICILDSTFKTNKFNVPLHIGVVIDNQGRSQIVFICLMQQETKENFTQLHNFLIQNNDVIEGIGAEDKPIIMIDEDKAHIAALEDELSDRLDYIICTWHKEVNIKKKIAGLKTKQEKEDIKNNYKRDVKKDPYLHTILENLPYYEDSSQIDDIELEIQNSQLLTQEQQTYFNTIYQNIDKWCLVYRQDMFTKGVKASQRVESKFGQLKQFLSSRGTITELLYRITQYSFQDLPSANNLNLQEEELIDQTFVQWSKNQILMELLQYLGLYAFKKCVVQLQKSINLTVQKKGKTYIIIDPNDISDTCQVKLNKNGKYSQAYSGTCSFFQQQQIPCSHIFAVKIKENQQNATNLYFSDCWKQDDYENYVEMIEKTQNFNDFIIEQDKILIQDENDRIKNPTSDFIPKGRPRKELRAESWYENMKIRKYLKIKKTNNQKTVQPIKKIKKNNNNLN